MKLRAPFVFACVLALVCQLLSLLSCGVPKTPAADRALARGAVAATADAVRAADEACAAYGTAKKDVGLLRSCEGHYDAARTALLVVGSAVDVWERADHASVACSLELAVGQLELLNEDLVAKGGRSLPAIADARALVATLGGCPDGS